MHGLVTVSYHFFHHALTKWYWNNRKKKTKSRRKVIHMRNHQKIDMNSCCRTLPITVNREGKQMNELEVDVTQKCTQYQYITHFKNNDYCTRHEGNPL